MTADVTDDGDCCKNVGVRTSDRPNNVHRGSMEATTKAAAVDVCGDEDDCDDDNDDDGGGGGVAANGLWYDDDDDWPPLPLLLLLLPPSYGLIWNGLESKYDGCTEAGRL